MLLLWAIVFALGWGIGTLAWPLYRNWTLAKKLQVPLILCPINQHGLAWRCIRGSIPDHHLAWLANYLHFLQVTSFDWFFQQKCRIYDQYGDVFVLVSPSGIQLFIADMEASREILLRGVDFPKPTEIISKIDLFGSSLASVEGKDWKRHRRATAAAFSDNINETVWEYSSSKAASLLRDCLSHDVVSDTNTKLTKLTFSVLMKACLGVEDQKDAKSTFDLNLAERHLTQLLRMMSTRITVRKVISVLGKSGPNLFGESLEGLKNFFTQLITQQRDHPSSGSNGLSSMLALGDQSLLSINEIRGNLFLLMFAGHETTANTLLYTIYLLAIFPEWQTWATDELNNILSSYDSTLSPSMPDILNRAPRLRAIIYETLRLYGPLSVILRKTATGSPQTIRLSRGRKLSIPGHVGISILPTALHTNPDIWGSDSRVWNPGRWIDRRTVNSEEVIDTAKLDSLFAWGKGLRACPGRKFSECEMLAVLMTFLRGSSIQVATRGEMSPEEARLKALEVVNQSKTRLTLQMEHPGDVHLDWSPR